MSDSNIYMALTQFSAFHLPITERGRQQKSRDRQIGIEGGVCFETEGGELVMPSVLIATSRLDGVLRPIHLDNKEKNEIKKVH